MIVFDFIVLIILFIMALVLCVDKVRHSAWAALYLGITIALLGAYHLFKNPEAALFLQEYILPVAGLVCSALLAIWLIKINVKDKKQP